MFSDVYLSIAILCGVCLLLGAGLASWWHVRKEAAVYRMRGEPTRPKKNYPSEHDFIIVQNLTMNLVALIDTARKQAKSRNVDETLFHVRGFIHEEMGEVQEFVRPRK